MFLAAMHLDVLSFRNTGECDTLCTPSSGLLPVCILRPSNLCPAGTFGSAGTCPKPSRIMRTCSCRQTSMLSIIRQNPSNSPDVLTGATGAHRTIVQRSIVARRSETSVINNNAIDSLSRLQMHYRKIRFFDTLLRSIIIPARGLLDPQLVCLLIIVTKHEPPSGDIDEWSLAGLPIGKPHRKGLAGRVLPNGPCWMGVDK